MVDLKEEMKQLKADLSAAKAHLDAAETNNDRDLILVYAPLVTALQQRLTGLECLFPKPSPSAKSLRQQRYKSLITSWTCRDLLKHLAVTIYIAFDFSRPFKSGPTLKDVLQAKDDGEGLGWEYNLALNRHRVNDLYGHIHTIQKGARLAHCALPELFKPEEWEILSDFNKIISAQVSNSTGKSYIIPSDDHFTEEMVTFLKNIDVTSRIYKNDGAVSDGSSDMD
uniref:Uncharacterized protein n=1 Tax=Spongospora subterranea TaxID=70186 RepID=A0A0H5QSV7_9EUKA|eukprot:CRZ05103.1 hypothetical protein [Spongospora subterranea]